MTKFILPNQMNVEKFPFPEKEIECIINQIIRLNKECSDCMYNHHFDETLSILNDMLRLLTKPIMVIKND
jgi:hypothetical protein